MAVFGLIDFVSSLVGKGSRKNDLSRQLSDSTFAEIVFSYPDVWNILFERSCILLCPIASSLGEDTGKKKNLMSHILVPDPQGGCYKTLQDETVFIEGSDIVCGTGKNVKSTQ